MAEQGAGREATLWEHIEELAIRLRRIVIAFFVSAAVLSLVPAGGGESLYVPLVARLPMLIFQHVVPPYVEAFDGKTYKVLPIPMSSFESINILAQAIILLGLLGASPVIARELWAYIEPALYPHEKAFAKKYVFLFVLSFIVGVFFGMGVIAPFIQLTVLKLYPVYIPEAYKTGPSPFTNPGSSGENSLTLVVTIMPFTPLLVKIIPLTSLNPLGKIELASIPITVSIGEVVSFTLMIGLVFGLLFELPVIIYLLLAYGILDPGLFTKETMKYIFLGTVIVGIIVSPDPTGLGALAIGLSLYLPLHVAVALGKKKAAKRARGEEA